MYFYNTMGSVVKILPRYNYEDYCVWEGKWELIDGIPYAISPAPGHKHQHIASNLSFEFETGLRNIACKNCKVYQPIDYIVDENTILQPDLLIVCKPITGKVLDFAPDLVVEILSPSTALKDRNTKFDIYESQGILYYLIVDHESKTVEIYRLQDKKYSLITTAMDESYTFDLGEHCKPSFVLNAIWE